MDKSTFRFFVILLLGAIVFLLLRSNFKLSPNINHSFNDVETDNDQNISLKQSQQSNRI